MIACGTDARSRSRRRWREHRVLLHFGAVDWETEVFVNGKSLGVHRGGYDPFSFDLTDALRVAGDQEIIVRVYDPTDDYGQPRGKQTLHPGGITYTSCSGIWQTVWLEPVSAVSIEDLKLVPDMDGGQLRLTAFIAGKPVADGRIRATIKDQGRVVAAADGAPGAEMLIPLPGARPWSPDQPFLYDLEVALSDGNTVTDQVTSYFGMRKIEVGEENGVKRMLLNGKFVFELGPLDQGFWPDGIYTQPTEAALKYDIEMMKKYGFNMVRKHIKVEPARWYYWCDKLGLMVWQDMPSPNTYVGKKYRTPPVDAQDFERELQRMITTHWNAPSIIMWDLFNEAQGQHDAPRYVEMVRKLDPSRLVDETSGWTHKGSGDVLDDHHYPLPALPKPNGKQALVCGEFGGIAFKSPGHMWPGVGHGYTSARTPADLADQYAEYIYMLKGLMNEGLNAAVYTQLTDVETEINGLMTYDRVPKVEPAKIALANVCKYPVRTYTDVAPTSEQNSQTWKYTLTLPAAGWFTADFADAAWQEGRGGFGHDAGSVKTSWNIADIWLRRHFNPGALDAQKLADLVVRDYHDEDMEVYINGVEALRTAGYITAYEYSEISPEAKKSIKPNADNVLAVHCHQTVGGQFIDVGLVIRSQPQLP